MSKKIKVRLGSRTYETLVGSGAVQQLGLALRGAKSKRAFLIADARLTAQRALVLETLKKAGWSTHEIVVEAGEGLKEFSKVYPLYGELLKARADRDSTIFALGGGTVGDAIGFVASTYLRGIPWVGLPTTLLAQVDSSLGGKTGVNHEQGKNLVGTFCQPSLVICDTDFLSTLSAREMISGLGEVVKYGLTFDRTFLTYVQSHWGQALARDRTVLTQLVSRSLAWKAKTVAKDEFDRFGTREVLNFGHTFAHALEAATAYQIFQHGEAVVWGMRFALALSQVRRKLANLEWEKLDSFLRQIPVPPLPAGIPSSVYFDLMSKDKKISEGKVRFVLLRSVGKPISDKAVQRKDLEAALARLKGPHAS